MDDIERPVAVGERAAVTDVQLQPGRRGDRRCRHDGRREDLGPAVDADDRQATAALVGTSQQRHRDVGAAGPDVEHRERVSMRGERIDRVCAQPHPTEPAVDPAQVAQVAGERRRIVQRPVEKLDGIGEAVHRASVRRAGTMGRMIVVAGEALIDILVQPDGRLTAVPGGGPFNTARTIGRLGGQVAFLGRLSNDRFGGVLRDGLTESDVDLSLTEATDAPTTLAIAELDDDGAATYRFHTTDTSAAALSPDAVEAALARRPRAVHLGTLGLALEPVADVLAAAIPAVGVETLVMLDPNCRPRVIRDRAAYLDRLERILTRADVVKVSIDDLAYLAPDRSPTAAAQAFLDRGATVVLVTDGPGPVLIVTATGVAQLAIPVVSIVDTVGAGDAFGGGFLARWIERGSGREDLADSEGVRDAVAFGIAVAVRTCQRAGADPPRRADLPRAVA